MKIFQYNYVFIKFKRNISCICMTISSNSATGIVTWCGPLQLAVSTVYPTRLFNLRIFSGVVIKNNIMLLKIGRYDQGRMEEWI